ncbi:MAG: hypothetical protein IT444_06430 [Phycisphaeraceae bacterium]|nr:hypothetical protein [Phycisphaeraceae bacterium]
MKSRSFRSLLSAVPSFYGMTKLAPRVSPGSLFEALEERKMLTLLGLVPAQPLISYNSTGVTTYTAGSDSFDVTATPLLFLNGAPPKTVDPVRDFQLHFTVDNAGNFAGGVAGDDFILEGNINTDGVPGYEYTGTLLTAEVTAFGWVNGGTSDSYDVRLQVTGGALAPLYAGSDLGITILSEHSNFNGDFTVDFTGGAKGNIGAVPTVFDPRPAINVIKYTNGTNNDNPTTPGVPNGPIVPVGSVVTWDYTVTNPGNEPIAIDKLTGLSDDNGTPGNTSDDFYATYVSGDINNNGELDLTESWSFTASGIAVAGQYENYGTVTGTSTISNTPLTASNVDHYFAVDPKINIVKLTNGTDNDSPTGPYVQVGSVVTWTYNVTNPGDEAIKNVVVTDNIPGVTPTYVSGDTNLDNQLDLTETWVYTASGVAVAGQYANIGTVNGNGAVSNIAVTDDNPDHYFGVTPGIDLEKFTNGVDATSHANAPLIAPGATVTWTYQVTNTGGLAFTQSQVVIVDDAGTPGNTSDDFSTTSGDITLITATDVGSDGILSAGEVWTYTASGVAQNLGGPVGSTITIDMSGSSSLDGTDGNIRTFSAGGVSVKASAWSREKGSGDNWSAAYLGSYGGGLGVTDSGEGSGGSNSHTVDNVGRDNYVLFEFDQSVVVDSAFLGYVVGDSDLRVWIGNATDPYNNHLSLNDATLAGLGFTELNLASNGNTRTADFNSGNLAGNVLVIAASPDDTTPDDYFKIDQLDLRKTDQVCYENYAVVTVPGATDNDNSFYCNPDVPPPQTGKITGYKYQDTTGNGLSSDDTGLGGVKIKLYNDVNNDGKLTSADGAAIASTYTANGTGYYEFTGLADGNYLVEEVVPDGWVRTGPALVDYVAAQVVNGSIDNTDNNFANYDTNDCTCNLSCVYYVINGCRTVYDLTGNVTEGDTVTVYFNLDSTETLSLVSYTAPSPNFVASEASQQVVFDFDTKTFGPGKHSLTVEVPCSYFQIDFVCGPVIDKFGPAGSNIFYTPQGRLIDADNGGSLAGCGFGSIAGSVYYDKDNDGVKESGETGIGGVKVVLTGTNDQGQSVNLIRYTNSNGDYKFTGLRAGNYKLTETQPDDYLDGKEKAGSKGGNISVNDMISSIVLASGNNATGYNFGEIKASSLCGYVYNDKDNDGVKDCNEDGISGVKITLTGTDDRGQSVSVTTYTDSCGKYSFANLRPGTYKLTETQPSGWNDGKDRKGNLGGSVYNDYISSIKLGIDKDGYNYNFGERSKYRSWC